MIFLDYNHPNYLPRFAKIPNGSFVALTDDAIIVQTAM